jgi:hypothetical protein
LYLNGIVFQANCVNFEIKKEQTATPLISDYLSMFFQKHCVDFEGKINK